MKTVERWLPVVGFPGYEVSECGRVRSYKVDSSGKLATTPQRILKGGNSQGNYPSVCLCNAGEQRSFYIHRLVTEAFLGACPDGLEVCHNDGNPQNNHLDNLRYDTHQANVQDMMESDGWRPEQRKLTDDQAIQLRILRFHGSLIIDLATQFGIDRGAVEAICKGETYQEVGGPRVKHGKKAPQPPKKLTWRQVCDLRKDREAGIELATLSIKYGVSVSMCSRIAHHKRRTIAPTSQMTTSNISRRYRASRS